MTNEQKSLVDAIGDEHHELIWTEDLGFGWFLGYYLLGAVLFPITFSSIPIENRVIRVLACLLAPCVPAAIAWMVVRRKSLGNKIRFDRWGFSVLKKGVVTFEQTWSTLAAIDVSRHVLVCLQVDGRSLRCVLPSVKRTRSSQNLTDLLRTYTTPPDRLQRRKQRIMKLALIAIIGITGAVLIGRPAMLSPFYEGPISLAQYGLVALWAGCLGMILIGSIGLVLVVGMEFIRNDIKKDNSRESKFGPNTQQFLESTSYWPKPIDLEEGKQYRYMDPDGVKQSIKDQISELWSITVCCLSMPLIAVIGISLSSRQTPLKPDEKVAFVVSSILLVGGALVPFILVPKKRLRFDYVNDVISLVYGELQVNRGDQILRYPREPKREMADTLPQKGTKKPFGRVERYGTAPNQYEMDRRYLIEVESSS